MLYHFPFKGPLFLLKQIKDVDRINLHRDVFVLRQRWEIISLGFQNEFVLSFSCLKMHIFSLRSLISVKKSHVDRRILLRDVFVLRQRWEITFLGFQNDFVLSYSCLKMHIFPLRSLIFVKKNHMLTEKIFLGMSLHRGNSEKSFP